MSEMVQRFVNICVYACACTCAWGWKHTQPFLLLIQPEITSSAIWRPTASENCDSSDVLKQSHKEPWSSNLFVVITFTDLDTPRGAKVATLHLLRLFKSWKYSLVHTFKKILYCNFLLLFNYSCRAWSKETFLSFVLPTQTPSVSEFFFFNQYLF